MIFCFCNEVQLKEYLDWMNNEIFFFLGGYQFFVYEIFFLNFSFFRYCRDFINGGFNLNGVCEKFEIEVLMFRKKIVFDYCYIVEEK